jgi:hypothetical protein
VVTATLTGALKPIIEAAVPTVTVYRGEAPEGAAMPHVVIRERISLVPRANGDFGKASAERWAAEEIQVDVWQQFRTPSTLAIVEDPDLADGVWKALHGAVIGAAAPTQVMGVRVTGSRRLPDPDPNVRRDVLSVTVERTL